jgi:uncharacterized protein
MTRRWYREPMVWLMLALPASAVIAGVVTLQIAGRARWDASLDPVTRVAQVQTIDRAPDERAAVRGLAGSLRIDRANGAVVVTPVGEFAARAVVLQFAHVADATHDRDVTLVAGPNGDFAGQVELARGAYELTLSPADASFRLRGRLAARVDAAVLAPSVTQ